MPRDYIEGHLEGAGYVYDRAAYKKFDELTESAEAEFEIDVEKRLESIPI